ncbi:MAG: hydrogenase subunit MbhD domain-containing protein [Rhodospirillales bacterium]
MTSGGLDGAVDALLALGIVWLAWQVVSGRTLFRSIVMFVVLGLVMAVTWARLRAPDLALAEAAIGAGVTGAMFILAHRRLLAAHPDKTSRSYGRPSVLAAPLATLSAVLVLGLGVAVLDLPSPTAEDGVSAGAMVGRLLADTGVDNPVTGVLLLFRGYDTLLEMAVLFAAWLGLCIVQPPPDQPHRRPTPLNPMLEAMQATAVPSAVLVGGYLLYIGSKAPGGAFQAGAVLAAAGVLLVLTGRLRPEADPALLLRIGVVLGLLAFCLIGLGQIAFDQRALALPGLWAVYLIEGAMALSIALTLTLLVLGAAATRRGRR